MDVLVALIALALAFAGVAALVFLRAVGAGQFDDLETPRHRLLADDEADPSGDKTPAKEIP